MLLSNVREYLAAEFTYPVELQTVVERAGAVHIITPDTEGTERLDSILGPLGPETFESVDALSERIHGNVSGEFSSDGPTTTTAPPRPTPGTAPGNTEAAGLERGQETTHSERQGAPQVFTYEPERTEQLSTAVVTAVARAHDEDVLDQEWLISEDINTDALDGLFQAQNLKMALQFEADGTTATITADGSGNPVIKIRSHR